MAKFTIEIDCDTAAFVDRQGEFSPEPELAFILIQFATKSLANMMLQHRKLIPLKDSHGILVGRAKLTPDKPVKDTT